MALTPHPMQALLRVRDSPSPPTHSEPGRCPPQPFYRPRGRAWGVMLRSKVVKIHLHFPLHSLVTEGLPLDKIWKQLGSQTPVIFCPWPLHSAPPLLSSRCPLPSSLSSMGCEGIAAFSPGSESSLSLSRTGGGEGKHLGERRAPRPRGNQRCSYGAPAASRTVHSGSSAGPGTDREQRGSPCPSQSSSPPEEGGLETVARETAGLS